MDVCWSELTLSVLLMSPMLLFLSPCCSDEVTDVFKTLWPDKKYLPLFKSLKMLFLLIGHNTEVCGNKLVASAPKAEVSSSRDPNFHKWARVLKYSLFFSFESHSVWPGTAAFNHDWTKRMTKGALWFSPTQSMYF